MGNYAKTDLVLNMFYGDNNHAILDDRGIPSIMVYIPKFKLSDVIDGASDTVHPAFIVNGEEKDGIYISKYQNIVYGGRAYSFPAETPTTAVSLDAAMEYCSAKGAGWHVITAAEWAAIALWCKKNGHLPRGNNDYGKDVAETEYIAIPAIKKSDGRTIKVATGTGPTTWSHDNTIAGIWDLNGNIAEWVSGIRLVSGELQILENNNAADSNNSQDSSSAQWKAISAADGSLVEPNSSGTVKLDYVDGWTFSTSLTASQTTEYEDSFGTLTCTADISDAAKELLRALALLPEDGATAEEYGKDVVRFDKGFSEAYMFRGGTYGISPKGGSAGIFALTMAASADYIAAHVGFRSAYYAD